MSITPKGYSEAARALGVSVCDLEREVSPLVEAAQEKAAIAAAGDELRNLKRALADGPGALLKVGARGVLRSLERRAGILAAHDRQLSRALLEIIEQEQKKL